MPGATAGLPENPEILHPFHTRKEFPRSRSRATRSAILRPACAVAVPRHSPVLRVDRSFGPQSVSAATLLLQEKSHVQAARPPRAPSPMALRSLLSRASPRADAAASSVAPPGGPSPSAGCAPRDPPLHGRRETSASSPRSLRAASRQALPPSALQ